MRSIWNILYYIVSYLFINPLLKQPIGKSKLSPWFSDFSLHNPTVFSLSTNPFFLCYFFFLFYIKCQSSIFTNLHYFSFQILQHFSSLTSSKNILNNLCNQKKHLSDQKNNVNKKTLTSFLLFIFIFTF